ncbi:hypothetical protein [Hugenholtzia roseola]|uniref:hypothetical protein n=1 Tax=Hugenholtzia roseola TaxID=1002 RepID=UPI0004189BF6|nr:hypothetical protein [Hugenholtzia roseola]
MKLHPLSFFSFLGFSFLGLAGLFLMSCESENEPLPNSSPKLRFEFKFDKEQARLNNLAEPSVIPEGNAAQTPLFNAMSIHYLEFAPSAYTALGAGQVLYFNEELPSQKNGFRTAIDFSKAIVSEEGKVFLEIPLSELQAGRYEWVRASVSYQNYDIKFNLKNIPIGSEMIDLDGQVGTLASFLGYNTHITTHQVKQEIITVNDDKKQGFWAFESEISLPAYNFSRRQVSVGESAGTTVVNPLAATSPIPAGSCVITGAFAQPLEISGNESQDIHIVLSFSIKESFEWRDTNANGEWDIDIQSNYAEPVVDMGLRGLQVKRK